ncbi:MAG TPA: PglZ domain-containing protein [Anaerolineales bacterium]|nr:PglZ domain-containing protein [Anaerolineales bacterium]
MGLIANTLLTTLQEALDRQHVVVWFDPELAYGDIVAELEAQLTASQTIVERYDPGQGFLALRRALEPVWGQDEPPRLLIYVPLAEKDTHNALAEFIVGGVKLEPGAHPPEYNTRLALVARRSLEKALPAATVEKIVADVEAGKLNLADIETLAEKGQEVQMGVLSIVFQTSNVEEIALRFLTDSALDQELAARTAGPALASLFNEALAAGLGEGHDLAALRAALTRHLLLTEFLDSLTGELPAALKTIPLPANKAARQAAVQIAQTWRLRRDLGGSYEQAALKLEAELGLGGMAWTIAALRASETFLRLEGILQALLEQALVEKPSKALLELAEKRLNGFWASQRPEVKLHWQVMAGAAQVMLQAGQIQQALKSDLSAAALFKRYAGDDAAWCGLDTQQRHLQRDVHNLDLDVQEHDSLLKLVAASQQAYAETVHRLAQRFVHAYEAAGFNLPGVVQQADVYHDFVEPAAASSPVAYILVDAFRYEMARELCSQIAGEWEAGLTPALATPPTITEVGMGALMPGAEKGVTLVPAGPSKLGVGIFDVTLKSRPERVKHLEKKGPPPVVVTELNQIAPLKGKALRDNLKAARLVVVTATDEIDGLWENQPPMARQLQHHVFDQLRRGIRTLFGLGIGRVIITADHGYLAGDQLMVGEALDAPGGEMADLHRRVWVGKGGALTPACLRKPFSAFGIGGDLEIVTPYGMSTFKVQGGSTEYFHGGLSLQELVIPIVSVSPGKAKTAVDVPAFRWTITPGSKQISTRFFSVTVTGESNDLLSMLAPPRVRVELRAGSQVISVPVAASYGFNEATRDVAMEFTPGAQSSLAANTITLQITDIPAVDMVTLVLLDELGASLCPEMKLAIYVAI